MNECHLATMTAQGADTRTGWNENEVGSGRVVLDHSSETLPTWNYGILTSNFPVACGFDSTHCIPSSIQSSQSFDAFFKPSPNLL
jgi:hypothetical protein